MKNLFKLCIVLIMLLSLCLHKPIYAIETDQLNDESINVKEEMKDLLNE